MKPRGIRGIVFDLGGVLVHLNSHRFFETWGHRKGKSAREFIDAIEAWGMFDRWERGGCSEGEFFEAFKGWIGIPSIRLAEFRRHWNGIFPGAAPGAAGMIRKLKRRYRLYALSNTTDTHFDYLRKRFRWLDDFDRVFTSFELKSRKPEPVIFERMVRKLRIRPEAYLYVDDRRENLEVAERTGFQVEHCPDPDHLRGILEGRGLLE